MTTRPIRTAELLAVGTELTTGETRDTNGGDLARELTALGVVAGRLTAVPDTLDVVVANLIEAMSRSDLIVTSGGLGPTPDDLTREAIAQALGVEPYEDEALMAWLRERWERRGVTMADANRKQAWLIPGAVPLANPNGSAPGWWVDRPDGGLIVALPGPPRELQPMWRDAVTPRLAARGVGSDRASTTLRLTGIGESDLVERIGEALLRAANPIVATYARDDAVDVRVSAYAEPGRNARTLVDATVRRLESDLAELVFAHGEERWPDALAIRLGTRTLAAVELGTAGALAALLGDAPFLVFLESIAPGTPLAAAHGEAVEPYAIEARRIAAADVGLVVRAVPHGDDTAVTVAVALDGQVHRRKPIAFLAGEQGRRRAAVAACAELWRLLGREAHPARLDES